MAHKLAPKADIHARIVKFPSDQRHGVETMQRRKTIICALLLQMGFRVIDADSLIMQDKRNDVKWAMRFKTSKIARFINKNA